MRAVHVISNDSAMERLKTLLPSTTDGINTLTNCYRSVPLPLDGMCGRSRGDRTMSIVYWIVVGIIAGFLAKVVVPGEGPGGIIGDLIVGVLGALIGGFVAGMLHIGGSGFIATTIIAFVGAVILLFVLRAVTGRRNAA